jgi:hypothetical protein
MESAPEARIETVSVAVPIVNVPADPFAAVVASANLSREKLAAAFAGAGVTVADPADPFARVVAEADLSRDKLLAAFAGAGMEIADARAGQTFELAALPATDTQPADDPFAHLALGPTGLPGDLAYAAADAGPDDPVELALASLGDDPLDAESLEMEPGIDAAIEAETMPESVDLPPARPNVAKPAPEKPAVAAKPKRDRTETAAAPAREPTAPEPRRRTRSERGETQALAYARPDNPAGGAFGKLFKSPKAGGKVAVYDISAATVHMPDGSKLRAHSGIGKMADNPRYVHVKMKGPTPPNTYRLSMREKRFHGVEAIRMTPVGEQTMHGRDGILAHSFLLRGGRAESHGCVAFADYPKFLKAFKQGKITHMIVVPSMSKMPKVQMVSAGGRGA